MKNRNGFTLIELAVVVMVLGILLGIMVPGVAKYLSNAKEKECSVNRKAILLEWDARKVLDPGTQLADVIAACSDGIRCPEQAVYFADGNKVCCPIHGEDSSFSDETENLGEVGEMDTEVVTEPEDKTDPIVPSEPVETERPSETEEPSEPTEPAEPEIPSEPDVPKKEDVLADGKLLQQNMHQDMDVREKLQQGAVYWVEQLDGKPDELYICIDNYSTWYGYGDGGMVRVNLDNIYDIHDWGEFLDGGHLILSKFIPPGTVVCADGEYYVFNTPNSWGGMNTDINNKNYWTKLNFQSYQRAI